MVWPMIVWSLLESVVTVGAAASTGDAKSAVKSSAA
jgi:hypothetical protein